jgi:PPOX class probable F420-dependent enzyme
VAPDLTRFAALVERDSLCVVTSTRSDGSAQATVVNAGVHEGQVAFVARGDSLKVRNLRARPAVSVTARVGHEWATVEGGAELLGPGNLDREPLRLLLRQVFVAAGGTHDDWDTYDRVMAEEGRVAVLVRATRIYGIP